MPLLSYGEVEQADSLSGSDMSLEESGESTNLGREFLLFQEIPVVVITASRVEQPILESPSTITVLTKEDIKRYGVTSFSDLLRNVPGVDIMSMSATDRNIGMRGFNHPGSGKILSLVDGIPIYLDFYGLTSWEALPVSVEEIERIEIIRGPGSALYGANALDGVINIITDSSLKNLGTTMTAKVNHSGKLSGSVVHGDRIGNLGYKASLGWDSISGWDDEDSNAGENKRLNGHLSYTIDDHSEIHLSGRTSEHQGEVTGLPGFEPIRFDTTEGSLKIDYIRSNLKLHLFYRRLTLDGSVDLASLYHLGNDTIDSELQHSFYPVTGNFITWGLNWKFNRMDSDILDSLYNQNLWATYIQDQIRLSRSLNLTVGLRYDRHPLTGNNFSPRGSIIYSPTIGHALRASLGSAFRNPSFVHSYISLDYRLSTPLFPTPMDIEILGNRDLSPEWMTSFELGYQGRFGTRLKGGVDLFINRLEDSIILTRTETYAEDALFPGSPGGVIPSVVSAINQDDAKAIGGEIVMDLSITPWLSAYANYSYQYVTDSKTGERIDEAAQHRVNPSLCIKPGQNLSISLFANYMSGRVRIEERVDPYLMLNSALSYSLGGTEIGLSVSNLLNDKHLEYPGGDEIGRSMILSLMYRIQ